MADSGTANLRGDGALLTVEHLRVEFPAGGGRVVHAVSDLSFDVMAGETLGLVGESGCGKSTTGRAIMRLNRIAGGSVRFAGKELAALNSSEMREVRRGMQMIFQDPISSLNPRRRVGDIIAEPLAIWTQDTAEQREARVRAILESVGLDYDTAANRRPHEFSGGQCQRISIARALMLEPDLVICDEPVSALDVSVQAQIINLLSDMKEQHNLTLVFIAHDLAVVKNVSDRVAVMYLGKMCETGAPDDLYSTPAHPYTAALIASIPVPDPDVNPSLASEQLSGELPSPMDPPSGCRFRTRCPRSQDRCAAEEPVMREVGPSHFVACHFPLVTPVDVTAGIRTEAVAPASPMVNPVPAAAPGAVTGTIAPTQEMSSADRRTSPGRHGASKVWWAAAGTALAGAALYIAGVKSGTGSSARQVFQSVGGVFLGSAIVAWGSVALRPSAGRRAR